MAYREQSRNARWYTQFDAQTAIMYVKVEGRVFRDDWIAIVNDGGQRGRQFAASKFVIDYRSADVFLGTSDLFERPTVLSEAGIKRNWRVALVYSEAFIGAHGAFVENVATNRGWPTRVFSSVDDAMRWLRGDPTDRSDAHGIGELESV